MGCAFHGQQGNGDTIRSVDDNVLRVKNNGDSDSVSEGSNEYVDTIEDWFSDQEDISQPPWYGEDLLKILLDAEHSQQQEQVCDETLWHMV